MRFTKTDPQLGELVVETTSASEAAQLRASGFREDEDASSSKARRKAPASADTKADVKSA